jgi:hypothetical protein
MTRLGHHEALGALDRDGQLGEAFSGLSRGGFIAAAVAGVGGFGAALAATAPAAAAGEDDIAVLRFLLRLKQMQAVFYTQAERVGAISGRDLEAARVIGAAERASAQGLARRLGKGAPPVPTFDFQGATEDRERFLRTAVALEDLGAAAIQGAVAELQAPLLVVAVASLDAPEARHAGWMRALAGVNPAPRALDAPQTRLAVERVIASTGFVADAPTTETRGRPSFTG